MDLHTTCRSISWKNKEGDPTGARGAVGAVATSCQHRWAQRSMTM